MRFNEIRRRFSNLTPASLRSSTQWRGGWGGEVYTFPQTPSLFAKQHYPVPTFSVFNRGKAHYCLAADYSRMRGESPTRPLVFFAVQPLFRRQNGEAAARAAPVNLREVELVARRRNHVVFTRQSGANGVDELVSSRWQIRGVQHHLLVAELD